MDTTPDAPNPSEAPAALAPLRSEYADDEMLADLVATFAAELADRAASIQQAADADDTARLGILIHQLKGSAGGYGFPTISDQAARTEQELRGADPDVESAVDGASQELAILIDLCRRASA